MKRKILIVMATSLAMILVLTSCGGGAGMSGVSSEDQKSYVINADKASKGDFMTGGGLLTEEGDTITIKSELEGDSEIEIKLIAALEGEDIDAEDLENIDSADAAMTMNATGTDESSATFPAGDYYVSSKVISKKATGTVTLTVESGNNQIANPWSEAASSKEAAEGAGVGSFDAAEGVEISLGKVDHVTYKYMSDIAESDVMFPAVDMVIRKGKSTAATDGDISGDYNKYKNQWTQNIKGLEVTCFGNREGEATKTIWTADDFCYSITAYGMGGDTDYGLSPDDLNSLINAIQ